MKKPDVRSVLKRRLTKNPAKKRLHSACTKLMSSPSSHITQGIDLYTSNLSVGGAAGADAGCDALETRPDVGQTCFVSTPNESGPPPPTSGSPTRSLQSTLPHTCANVAPFLCKLWWLCQTGGRGVIKWGPTGTDIVISTHAEVQSTLMPLLCQKVKSTHQFSAFQRQLNNFGFRKVHGGRHGRKVPFPFRGMYRNELFRQDRPDLLSKIIRRGTKGHPGNNTTGATTKRMALAKLLPRLQDTAIQNGPLPLSHSPKPGCSQQMCLLDLAAVSSAVSAAMEVAEGSKPACLAPAEEGPSSVIRTGRWESLTLAACSAAAGTFEATVPVHHALRCWDV